MWRGRGLPENGRVSVGEFSDGAEGFGLIRNHDGK